jgi:hypothetical protein
LRRFYRRAEPLLKFDTLWFDSAKRQAIVDAFGEAIRSFGYTVYASAVVNNHAHHIVRRHRDDHKAIWDVLAHASREALRRLPGISAEHPIWSDRPYSVFLYREEEIEGRIKYVNDNFTKHGIPKVVYSYITRYDGWPHTRRPK